jgi:hypothetical protein
VTTNDPVNPVTQLEVIADLKQLLAASPNRHWFGQIKQDEVITRQFTFEGSKLNEVTLTSVRMKEDSKNKDAFTWKIHDVRKDGARELTLDVTVHANLIQPGRFGDILVVETDLEPSFVLELYLTGDVLGPISANPQRLYFGQFDMNREMENVLRLTANTEKPFKILTASIDDKEFRIDPWARDAAADHTITIRFLPKETRDRIRTVLVITTDLEAQPVVEVEIHAYQRRNRPDSRQRMDARELAPSRVSPGESSFDAGSARDHTKR